MHENTIQEVDVGSVKEPVPGLRQDSDGNVGCGETSCCPCDEECALAKAVKLIGGKWKLRLLCTLSVDGTARFIDLARKTKGITSAMLSSSLKELEADGLVTRRQYEEIPPRVEYSLTEYARELWPILHRLAHWARREAPM